MWRLSLFILLFVLGSCASIQEPEFRGSDGFKLEKIEGKEIRFSFAAKVYNPNWFGIRVKPSHLEVYLEDQFMGKIFLDKKVKIKARRESDLNVGLRAELEDGAMITALRYSKADSVEVRLKGKVKGGVFILSKKFELDEKRTISGKNLRLGGMR